LDKRKSKVSFSPIALLPVKLAIFQPHIRRGDTLSDRVDSFVFSDDNDNDDDDDGFG